MVPLAYRIISWLDQDRVGVSVCLLSDEMGISNVCILVEDEWLHNFGINTVAPLECGWNEVKGK